MNYRISKILKHLGISPAVQGYAILRRAISLVIDNPSMAYHITTDLYPKLAIEFQISAKCIERSIRTAIESGWLKIDYKLIEELFGLIINKDIGRPTNAQFIAVIADYLTMQSN